MTSSSAEPRTSVPGSVTLRELRQRLPELMLHDQRRLGRRIEQTGSLRNPQRREAALREIAAELVQAQDRIEARRRSVPVITYPAELPVSQRKDEIARAIRDHQVVIVAGETGSGKTTQIPKICLELGRGVTGQIGHTQPRRLAARAVAERIADELGTELGSTVGYKVRFTDNSSDNTLVKLMTDGILLTELAHDRRLLRYDTLIIDEAHERSLNIDFILGYLHRLLPSRPDLKVIITSATIDPERFAAHFSPSEPTSESTTPVIEVSGRTYPVEVRYRPLLLIDPDDDEPGRAGQKAAEQEPRDQVQAILDAVDELCAEGPGDILVFLSGEREIRDTADALTSAPARPGSELEIVPLYARLSAAEQHRVFAAHSGRRVVLATNVAETSLTVPGIKYVIDPGAARISRYSNRTKVQRLPIEPISQASANQRKGRCGRTSDGICIRLYSEADYESRPEFTDPEILRTNLASVILRMADLDLGEVSSFPFIDPPETRNITDGIRLLEELGAVQPAAATAKDSPKLTEIGRQLARLPVDPRLGRMILHAGKLGCAREVLVITAALSIQDPKERPADAREAADAKHAKHAEPGSDFLSLVNLWDYLRERQRELSGSAFRRMCRSEYLHYLRVREWQDVHGQLSQAARDLGINAGPAPQATSRPSKQQPRSDEHTAHVAQLLAKPGTEPEPRFDQELADRVHQALLVGLLTQIGMREEAGSQGGRPTGPRRRGPAEYAGARAMRFAIFPDSGLARKGPRWVMAAELVETSRLWARVVARIEPEWVEPLAGHLVNRGYSEPHWDAKRGSAMALERVTLYGLPLVAARPVTLGRIDPVLARELFISHALVEGEWQTHHKFFHANRQLLADAEELERRARRRGIVADDAALFAFYDQRVPADVTSTRHFDSWWKKARQAQPDLLTMSPADLVGPAAEEVSPQDYPDRWGELPLRYEFAPGEPDDGVAADIPLASMNQVTSEEFSWQVPGLRTELVTELIRTLPKRLRTMFVPAPDVAREALARLDPGRGDLVNALAAELSRMSGQSVTAADLDIAKLPPHLRVKFRVTDADKVLAEGHDLDALRRDLRPLLHARLADAAADLTRTGLRRWDFDSLPREFVRGQVRAYPALKDAGDTVEIALFETRAQAAEAMRIGNRKLLLIEVPSGARSVASRLPTNAKLAMSRHPYPSASAEIDDCGAAAADEIIAENGGPAWDADAFAKLLDAARMSLRVKTADVVSAAARVLGEAHPVEARLDQLTNPQLAEAADDMRAQLAGLIYPGFISDIGARRLPDLVRYLRGIAHRLDKASAAIGRDLDRMDAVHRVSDDYDQLLIELGPDARYRDDVKAIRWMIEELRMSLFAQPLGAAIPVSEQRILAALMRLR
ncbi:MAG TPA: ATP-dependent RNA helicase HrpA [Streptosporangiaceae bacterium]|nr:ATP-dependent RNA helicase HrpA [Streptosporangiaceae bacterium]